MSEQASTPGVRFHGAPWTPPEYQRAVQLREDGLTAASIAGVLHVEFRTQRSAKAVQHALEDEPLRVRRAIESGRRLPKLRTCLRCRKQFWPSHCGNFLCGCPE